MRSSPSHKTSKRRERKKKYKSPAESYGPVETDLTNKNFLLFKFRGIRFSHYESSNSLLKLFHRSLSYKLVSWRIWKLRLTFLVFLEAMRWSGSVLMILFPRGQNRSGVVDKFWGRLPRSCHVVLKHWSGECV